MELLSKARDYLLPNSFEIYIYKDRINIISFTSIGEISSEKILIRHSEGSVIIKGEKLVLSKLMHDEVLIKGVLKNIEFR